MLLSMWPHVKAQGPAGMPGCWDTAETAGPQQRAGGPDNSQLALQEGGKKLFFSGPWILLRSG